MFLCCCCFSFLSYSMPERMKDNQFISSPDTGRSIPRLTSMTKKKKKKRYVFYHNYWQCSEVQNITRLDLQAFTHTHTHTWTPKHNLKQVGADRHTHKQKHQQKQFNNNLCHKNPQDEQKKTVLWNGSVCVCVCLSKTIQEWAQKNKKKKSAQSLKDEGIRTVSQRVP